MNVLIVISNLELGGAQRVALNLNEWLNCQDAVSSSIVALKNTNRNKYQIKDGDNVYCLNGSNIIKNLRDLIRRVSADIVLSMGVPLSLYTVPACLGLKVRHIISERNDPNNFAGRIETKWLSHFLLRFGNGFVFQTEDAKNYYPNSIRKRSVIIHNPLFNTEKMPKQIYSGQREKVVVAVGRLNVQKNHSILIKAFNNIKDDFPEYSLIIYGEGPERSNLEKLISSLKLSNRVKLPGSFPDIFSKIYQSSLFVLSSDFEGMPNALMEAMALGIPCLSTDCPCGGPRALIENDINGCLVDVNDLNQLSVTIANLLIDEQKRKKYSKNAFKIRTTHSMSSICNQWLTFFKEQLS